MQQDRPRVFISSTIYDFRDLRSSLKYWLEEQGYEVCLSEEDDFPVESGSNSYENCISVIDSCDYFILLIGSRVGGLYDAENYISITQAEYRHAYERLLLGKIKILVLVRKELWTIREERKELERYIKSEALLDAELEESEIEKITKHPSKFANDAEFLFNFLNEVARNEEMKKAMKGEGEFPVGNWIHQFSQFRDVIGTLKTHFRIKGDLRRLSMLANLCHEIESNMSVLMQSNDSGIKPKYHWASPARRNLTGGFNDSSEYKGSHLRWLAIFVMVGGSIGKELSTEMLDELLVSGEVLEFDRETGSFVAGDFQKALLDLKYNINRLKYSEQLLNISAIIDEFKRFDAETDYQIENDDGNILLLFSIHDILYNIVQLNKAVHRAISDDHSLLSQIRLLPSSPIDDENSKIEKHKPTPEQIEDWLNQPN